MKPTPARPVPAQLALFPTTPRGVCEDIGLNWIAARRLHRLGHLSYDPANVDVLDTAQDAELRFVGTLVVAGCDEEQLQRLLANLTAPHSYSHESAYYHWSSGSWLALNEASPDETFDCWLERAVADGDAAELGRAGERIRSVLDAWGDARVAAESDTPQDDDEASLDRVVREPVARVACVRLAETLRQLGADHRAQLERWKSKARQLERDDAVWHLLLQSFATLGNSGGWKGLIGDSDNYARVTFDALAGWPRETRGEEIERTFRAARVRYPARKARHLAHNHELIASMGGVLAAKDLLRRQPGRAGKMAFLKRFKGIGDKYARDILMDVYHPDFRDSIALDSRVRSVSKALGLSFKDYDEHERFFLAAGRLAGLNGWEVDRLVYNFRDEVLRRLRAAAKHGTTDTAVATE